MSDAHLTALSTRDGVGKRRLRSATRHRVTIYDIARAAGVSSKTVSRVINREPYVREEKRLRVERAIRSRRYVPRALAQEFAAGTTRVIGLCFLRREPLLSKEYYFSEIFEAAHHALADQGYFSLLISPEHLPSGPTETVITVARARNLAGLLLADLAGCDHHRIGSAGFPVVVLSRRISDERISSVVPANADGMEQMVRHLHSLGHRRIAFFGDAPGRASIQERRDGFLSALRALSLPCPQPYVIPCLSESAEHVLPAVERFLSISPSERPTALCCVTDLLAVHAIEALAKRGVRVPEKVSVSGFDDEDFSRLVTPRLTTIQVSRAIMGKLSALALLKMVEDSPRGSIAEVPVRLIVRESTCPPAA